MHDTNQITACQFNATADAEKPNEAELYKVLEFAVA